MFYLFWFRGNFAEIINEANDEYWPLHIIWISLFGFRALMQGVF